MSLPVPPEPDDPRHMAHIFGDGPAGTIAATDSASAGPVWEQLDRSAVEDWQLLFARAYASKRGTA